MGSLIQDPAKTNKKNYFSKRISLKKFFELGLGSRAELEGEKTRPKIGGVGNVPPPVEQRFGTVVQANGNKGG